jgi:hypothetical protein
MLDGGMDDAEPVEQGEDIFGIGGHGIRSGGSEAGVVVLIAAGRAVIKPVRRRTGSSRSSVLTL